MRLRDHSRPFVIPAGAALVFLTLVRWPSLVRADGLPAPAAARDGPAQTYVYTIAGKQTVLVGTSFDSVVQTLSAASPEYAASSGLPPAFWEQSSPIGGISFQTFCNGISTETITSVKGGRTFDSFRRQDDPVGTELMISADQEKHVELHVTDSRTSKIENVFDLAFLSIEPAFLRLTGDKWVAVSDPEAGFKETTFDGRTIDANFSTANRLAQYRVRASGVITRYVRMFDTSTFKASQFPRFIADVERSPKGFLATVTELSEATLSCERSILDRPAPRSEIQLIDERLDRTRTSLLLPEATRELTIKDLFDRAGKAKWFQTIANRSMVTGSQHLPVSIEARSPETYSRSILVGIVVVAVTIVLIAVLRRRQRSF